MRIYNQHMLKFLRISDTIFFYFFFHHNDHCTNTNQVYIFTSLHLAMKWLKCYLICDIVLVKLIFVACCILRFIFISLIRTLRGSWLLTEFSCFVPLLPCSISSSFFSFKTNLILFFFFIFAALQTHITR